MRTDVAWSPDLEERSVAEDRPYWYWGEGGDLRRTSAARPLGSAGALAYLDGGYVLRTESEANMVAALTAQDQFSNEVWLLVRAVAEADTYTFGLHVGTPTPTGWVVSGSEAGDLVNETLVFLRTYVAVAWGDTLLWADS